MLRIKTFIGNSCRCYGLKPMIWFNTPRCRWPTWKLSALFGFWRFEVYPWCFTLFLNSKIDYFFERLGVKHHGYTVIERMVNEKTRRYTKLDQHGKSRCTHGVSVKMPNYFSECQTTVYPWWMPNYFQNANLFALDCTFGLAAVG